MLLCTAFQQYELLWNEKKALGEGKMTPFLHPTLWKQLSDILDVEDQT